MQLVSVASIYRLPYLYKTAYRTTYSKLAVLRRYSTNYHCFNVFLLSMLTRVEPCRLAAVSASVIIF